MSKLDEAKVGVVALDDSLQSLERASFKAGIEFSGMLGSLTKAAYSLNDAGKGWTTFSRLVSGSPLWAIQNKFRAYLSILASFEQRSKNNTDAMVEQRKRVLENFSATKKLSKTVKDLSKIRKMEIGQIEQKSKLQEKKDALDKRIEKREEKMIFNKKHGHAVSLLVINAQKTDMKNKAKLEGRIGNLTKAIGENSEELLKQVKSLDVYQYTLAATGSEEKAFIRSKAELIEKQKDANKQLREGTRAIKEQFAFDTKRIELQEKAAKLEAKRAGLTGRKASKFVKKAKKLGKRKMKAEQIEAISKQRTVGAQGIMKTVSKKGLAQDFKGLKLLAAPFLPILGLVKIAKDQRKIALKAQKMANAMTPVLNLAFKFFVFAIMGIIAGLLFIKGAYEVFKILQEMGLIAEIKDFFMQVWSVVLAFIGVIGTFISGDYKKAFNDLLPILDRAMKLILTGLGLLVKVAWETLVAGFGVIIDFFYALATNDELRERALKIGIKIGAAILGAYMIKTLALMALQVIATYAAPVLLGIFILAGLYSLVKFVYSKYATAFTAMLISPFNFLFDWVKKIGGWIEDIYDNFKDFLDNIDFFSSGGKVNTPMQVVGEKGPELVKLPRGSTVYSNAVSKNMTSGSSNTVVNNMSITINARDTSDAELRRIADKIGNMVNNKINRRTSSRTLG